MGQSGLCLSRNDITGKWGLAVKRDQLKDSIIFEMALKVHGLSAHSDNGYLLSEFIPFEKLFGIVPFCDEFHELEEVDLRVHCSNMFQAEDLCHVLRLSSLDTSKTYVGVAYRRSVIGSKVNLGFIYYEPQLTGDQELDEGETVTCLVRFLSVF